ncbi:MAG TPA: hypothetical protein VK633_06600 [Verrucomicrobiae bacterium]|nr:hypothetical protein [Verrucomicrobiae bacterium]
MTIGEFFILIFAALLYSGPVVPLSTTLLLRKRSRERFSFNLRLLAILTAVQVLAFLPYLLGIVFDQPDALHALILPFFTGVMLFIVALLYSIRECIRLRSLLPSPHDG